MARNKSDTPRHGSEATVSATPEGKETGPNSSTEPQWDLEAAVRLVEAVRLSGGKVPSRYIRPCDESEIGKIGAWRKAMIDLATDVSTAFTFKEVWPYLTDARRANAYAKDLTSLRGQFERARNLLTRKPELADSLDSQLPLDFPDINGVLDEILTAVADLQTRMGGKAPLPGATGTPQGAVLLSLTHTYQERFQAKPDAGFKRTWSNYSGPLVAFIRTSFEIAGKPLSEQTLTKAISRQLGPFVKGHRN